MQLQQANDEAQLKQLHLQQQQNTQTALGLQLSLQPSDISRLPGAAPSSVPGVLPTMGLDAAEATAMTVSAKTLARVHVLIPEAEGKTAEDTLQAVIDYVQRLNNKEDELTLGAREAPSA